MTHLRPVRAHWRRVPDLSQTPPHVELKAAWIRDLFRNARLTEWLADELERELQEMRT